MKKALYLTLALGVLLSLPSCTNTPETIAEPVNIVFGKLYDKKKEAKIEEHLKTLDGEGFASKLQNKEEFALLVYDKSNPKWDEYEKAILKFVKKENALIYAMEISDFKRIKASVSVDTKEGEITLAIFKDENVAYQIMSGGENDLLLDADALSSYLEERVHFSDMLYISLEQLEEVFTKKNDATIGFLRKTCLDCSFVEDAVLTPFNYLDHQQSYVIDCDVEGIRYKDGEIDEEGWKEFKKKYGLSEEGNADFGYNGGYVPTFFHYSTDGKTSPAESILDGCVYLNDTVKNVNGEYLVTDSYFTEEREPLLNFLGNIPDKETVLKGHKVATQEIENEHWKKESAAKYHNPLLKAFLDAYLSK